MLERLMRLFGTKPDPSEKEKELSSLKKETATARERNALARTMLVNTVELTKTMDHVVGAFGEMPEIKTRTIREE